MDTQPSQASARADAPASMGFSLLANPFAVLGATARTQLADLPALADAAGTAEAAAAARSLSVPRSRLGAEVAFLPGCAEATEAVLVALHQGRRPDPAALTALAAANLHAHLCAAGLALNADLVELSANKAFPGDEALAAMIDADRRVAGLPPCQSALLAAEWEAVSDRHAAALVAAVLSEPQPAARLAELIRGAGTAGFGRKVAAAWMRGSATALAELETVAAAASSAFAAAPGTDSAAALCRAVQAWAALTLPQRLADARSALDHPATLQAMRPWRTAALRVARAGRPDAALPVAQALAESFADLPGEAALLQAEVRGCAGLVEEQSLTPLLTRLNDLATRLGAAPSGLQAELAKRPFGPAACGDACELWSAFDAACTASTVSEAPWVALRALVAKVGGEHRTKGAAAALSLQQGMLKRAESAGRADLADRIRSELRGLERAVALGDYQARLGKRPPGKLWTPWWLGPLRRRRILAALRRALPLVDDPGERSKLLAQEGAIVRRIRGGRIAWAVLGMIIAVTAGVGRLDDDYAKNAPYRRVPPQSFAVTPNVASGVASVPIAPAPAPMMAPVETPEPLPFPTDALVPQFGWTVHVVEREPPPGRRLLTLAELRWCLANDVRLGAARSAATAVQAMGLEPLIGELGARCDGIGAQTRDMVAVKAETGRDRARLQAEGEAMLKPAP